MKKQKQEKDQPEFVADPELGQGSLLLIKVVLREMSSWEKRRNLRNFKSKLLCEE